MSVSVVYKENKNSSLVWNYFLKSEDGLTAKCKLCHSIIKISAPSTKGLHTHLQTKHNINLKVQSSSGSVDIDKITQEMKASTSSSSSLFSSIAKRSDVSGSSVLPKKMKITDFFLSEKKVSMEERVSRMVAKDGIPFEKFITSIDMRQLFESEGHKLPSSASTIQGMVMAYGESIKKKTIKELEALKNSKQRFTVTFDEWSSLRNRRYLNLKLHVFNAGAVSLWNLGLVRIFGSFPAESCVIACYQHIINYYRIVPICNNYFPATLLCF